MAEELKTAFSFGPMFVEFYVILYRHFASTHELWNAVFTVVQLDSF
jgi:hypothetical protein